MESGRIGTITGEELDLAATLWSGQVFRWHYGADGVWTGLIGVRRVRLRQDDEHTLWWEADGPDAETAVRRFLRLDEVNFATLAHEWCDVDALFAQAWQRQPGVRVLRQEPDECFFSFLCASVAPIRRISGMLHAVAGAYGELVEFPDGQTARVFPTAQALRAANEADLKSLGLGFRARRVVEAAQRLVNLPGTWLQNLRQESHADAKNALTQFWGVGEKIADCVCLFALDQDAAIPVDTHIWRMAQQRYAPELAGKSLTAANYARAAQGYVDKFGPYAGWAQQTLFYRAAVGRER